MDIVERTKRFSLKVLDKIEDRLAAVVVGVILLVFLGLCSIFWGWAKSKRSLEMYGWTWLLISFLFVFLCAHFLRSLIYNTGRLNNSHDIINALDNWFKRSIAT